MGKKKHYKHAHKDSRAVLAEMNHIARESRMADRSPWTAMSLLCCYSMLMSEGWKQQRLTKLMADINVYEDKWWAGEIEVEDYSKRLDDKAGWTIGQKDYVDEDIKHRKGSYDWQMVKLQLEPQNRINRQATRFFIWFYNVLIDYGYGEKRLLRICDYINAELDTYRTNDHFTENWRTTLYEQAGMIFENPKDTLTGATGTVML